MAANVSQRNRIDQQQQQQLWSPHYFQRLYQRKHLTRDWATFCLAIAMLIAFIISCLLQSCLAHVALTYPPARKYDLDFLDNTRTKGPCGMPKANLVARLPIQVYFATSDFSLVSSLLVNRLLFQLLQHRDLLLVDCHQRLYLEMVVKSTQI
uniref:Uncharacterized protein n=1 Tax=Glossina brevipalpis TaxID=37001 RepID=A0A1A9X3I8_9MUSC